ncbi:intracellular protein transport protein USO1-like isoform X2 [Euphorbia lathyris]|uniref:intracellular protein transport protein USO1-like isoform X2 n=1 Tax=Euphorbia lathyris TaxID=212925 RepID=UPI0033142607
MFRSARWRSEKSKIKSVFKLQFHATQVSQLNVDALMISVVPGDVGKPTAKLEKGIIREGSCRWESPIYETVKFTQDARTAKINERLYHFIVSTGSSKINLIGEVSIDLATYAEATKASTVSLPLKNSKSNAVLHISIQRLQGNTNQRVVEETEDANIKTHNTTLNTLLSNSDVDEGIRSKSNEVRRLNDANHNAELNGARRISSGSDITMSSSDSSSGLNTPREIRLRNSILQDPTNFLSSQSHASTPHKATADASVTVYEGHHQQSQWEWSADSDHGISTDDSVHGSQGTLTLERSQGTSDVEIEKMKAEMVALARQAELSELELQTLRKQIVKESKRGQDLLREIAGLKGERDSFKAECEKLKAFQKRVEDAKSKNRSHFEGGDPQIFLDEIRQELNHEKDLNANLRLQLQKTQESNAELILAVQDLEEMLERKNREVFDSSKVSGSSDMFRSETDDDEEQKALEEIVKEHRGAKETYVLEQKVIDLNNEIEMYRREKDELEMQVEQLALDYEILKQENHDMSYKLEQSQLQEQLKMQYECSSSFDNMNELEAQIESLENDLKKQCTEHSDSLVIIGELENHIKSLEDELEKQAQRFEADLEAVTNAKIEQEKKAIQAEEALRKTRWKNANTAEKLQEEVKRLSVQMASTFEVNEKVAMKAIAEADELQILKSQLEQMLHKANEELRTVRDDYGAKLNGLTNQLNLKMEQIEQLLVEIDDKSKQLEHQKKHNEELAGSYSEETLRLKSELEKHTIESSVLSELTEQRENMRAELQQLKVSLEHNEELVQKGNVERNELVSALALVKKEAEKLMEELSRMTSLKDEKEIAMEILQTEVNALKAQCQDLKHSLCEDELDKEKLRKQVFQLKGDLKKKDDTISSIEKKLKESNRRTTLSDSTKTSPRNNKSAPVLHGSKEASNLREKIKLLEGQIILKETSLENSANSFLEKERDLLDKIEELEKQVEELNQKSTMFSDNPCQKFHEDSISNGITSDGCLAEDTRSTDVNLSSMAQVPKQNGNAKALLNSDQIISEQEEKEKTRAVGNGYCNNNKLLSELESFKEKNELMENELKEMQERYSEISLKLAEVEGERQQLVMTVRNLKNSKKS